MRCTIILTVLCSSSIIADAQFLSGNPVGKFFKKAKNEITDLSLNAALENGRVFSMLIDAMTSKEQYQKIAKLFPSELQPLFKLLRNEARVRILQDFIDCTSKTELGKALRVDGSKIDLFKRLADVFDLRNKEGTPMEKIEGMVVDHSFNRIEWVTNEVLYTLQCVVLRKSFIKFVKAELPPDSFFVDAAEFTAKCPARPAQTPGVGKLMADTAMLANQSIVQWEIVSNKTKLLRIIFTTAEHPLADCLAFSFLSVKGYWTIVDPVAALLDSHLSNAFARATASIAVYLLKSPVAFIQAEFGDQFGDAIDEFVNRKAEKILSKNKANRSGQM